MSETTTEETVGASADTQTEGRTDATGESAATTRGSEQTGGDIEQPGDSDETEGGRSNREAAKYRTRLRETESERDMLAQRVTAMQRAEVERLAGTHLAKPAGLWAAGADMADLLDKDGNVDPGKVAEAAKAAMESLGLEKPRRGPRVPREGTLQSGSAGPLGPRTNSWTKAFTPKDSEY